MNILHTLLAPAVLALLTQAAAAAGGSEPPALRGVVWQLGADGPRPVHLRLDEKELNMTGYGGCNRLMGRFTLDGPRLRFDNLAGTRRACVDDNDTEDRFLAALGGVRGWRIEGGRLKLLSESGATLLDLRPGKAVP